MYPITYETYHVLESTATQPIVFQTLPLAKQYLSSLATGSIAHVEKVIETHYVYAVYGTVQNPLPTPANPIATIQQQITHYKMGVTNSAVK